MVSAAAQFLLERRRTEFNALNKEIGPLRKVGRGLASSCIFDCCREGGFGGRRATAPDLHGIAGSVECRPGASRNTYGSFTPSMCTFGRMILTWCDLQAKKDTTELQEKSKAIKKEIAAAEEDAKQLAEARDKAIHPIGNLVPDSVPISNDEVRCRGLHVHAQGLARIQAAGVGISLRPCSTRTTGPDPLCVVT